MLWGEQVVGQYKSCDIKPGVRRVEIIFQLQRRGNHVARKMIRLHIATYFLSIYLFKHSDTLTRLRKMRIHVNFCWWSWMDENPTETYLHIGQNYSNWPKYIYIYICGFWLNLNESTSNQIVRKVWFIRDGVRHVQPRWFQLLVRDCTARSYEKSLKMRKKCIWMTIC